ncbi:MAG: energy transducer TonB, partial [Terracidiphilus sp.]
RIASAVERINAIVVPEMHEYKGITIQNALRMDRETVARMAAADSNVGLNEGSAAPQQTDSVSCSGPQARVEGNFGSRFKYNSEHINSKLDANWNRYEVDTLTPKGASASIRFTVRQDGSLTDIRIDHPSGSPTLDQSCLRAAQRVDTFGPLPQEWEKSTLLVSYDCKCAGGSPLLNSGGISDATAPATQGVSADVGGNAGSGIYRIGGGVSAPQVLNDVEVEYSDEARRNKLQGTVLLTMIIAPDGTPQHIQVSRSLGMGLDEKAIEAVSKYRFKPAMLNGKPVPVRITNEVNFRLH